MGRPRVWEVWRCTICGREDVRPYRTLSTWIRTGMNLPCLSCDPTTNDWVHHIYVRDAPNPGVTRA